MYGHHAAQPFGVRALLIAVGLLVVSSASCSEGQFAGNECPDGAEGEECARDGSPDAEPPVDGTSTCDEPCGEGRTCVDGECVPETCEGEGCPCNYDDTDAGVCGEAETDGDGNCAPPTGYEEDETTCDEKDNDCDGEVDEECNCEYSGTSEGICSEGIVGEGGDCKAPPDYEDPEESCDEKDNDCDGETDEADRNTPIECSPGETETDSEPCSMCGERVRNCTSDCTWESWSDCQNEGTCSPGDMQTGSCGNCGEQTRTCEATCSWGNWSTCTGEGSCSPGDTDPTGCPDCRAKECKNDCSWTNDCTACTCQGFQKCGTSCPSGYHVASSSCDFNCSGGCSTSDNARFCEPNCGSSFTSCESSCPDGYHIDRTKCDFSCPGSCSTSDNAIVCVEN